MKNSRREFLVDTSKMVVGGSLLGSSILLNCTNKKTNDSSTKSLEDSKLSANTNQLFFKVSLAQWSLNKALFSGELDHLDFAKRSKEDFSIDAIEYVNQFF